MSTPDLSPYVPLVLVDTSAQELVEIAVTDAQVKLPGWTPREGQTEVVLLESQALIASELIFALNRVPGVIVESLLGLFQLTRDPGSPATTTLRFTTSSLSELLIPAGTVARLALDGGATLVSFATTAALTIAAGTGTGVAPARATASTAAANGTAAGTRLDLLDSIASVDTVSLATEPAGGVDVEDSQAFIERGVIALRRLVTTLVLPSHFTAAALATPGIERARTLDLYDPGAGGAPGSNPGHITVAVAAPGGTAVPTADKAALLASLTAQAMAPLILHVVDATVTAVNVAVTVAKRPGYTDQQVIDAVTARLRSVLDPDVWPFGGTVYRFELLAEADRAEGVARVVNVTTPAADVVLPGVAPLARLGTIAVTVQAA